MNVQKVKMGDYHANINIVETAVVWYKLLTTERVHQATSDAKQETFKSECFAAMETFINGAIQASQTSGTQQKYEAEIAKLVKALNETKTSKSESLDGAAGFEIIKTHLGNISKALLHKIHYPGMSEQHRTISFILKGVCEFQSLQEIIQGAQGVFAMEFERA